MPKNDTETRKAKLGYPGGLATRRAADIRARALRPTVLEIQVAGFVRLKDITAELNRRGVPATRGAKGWYLSGVARLLTRLRALEREHLPVHAASSEDASETNNGARDSVLDQ